VTLFFIIFWIFLNRILLLFLHAVSRFIVVFLFFIFVFLQLLPFGSNTNKLIDWQCRDPRVTYHIQGWQVSANIGLNHGLTGPTETGFCQCNVLTSSCTLAKLFFCYCMRRGNIAADEY